MLIPAGETENKYFVRTKDGSLINEFEGAELVGELSGETVFVTNLMPEKDFMAKAAGKCCYIRMMNDEK